MMQADWNFSRQLQNLLGVMDNVSAYTQGIFSKIKVVNHFIVWKKKKKEQKKIQNRGAQSPLSHAYQQATGQQVTFKYQNL